MQNNKLVASHLERVLSGYLDARQYIIFSIFISTIFLVNFSIFHRPNKIFFQIIYIS